MIVKYTSLKNLKPKGTFANNASKKKGKLEEEEEYMLIVAF